ncbi:MAG TPA: phosphatase PAP2 family protein [Flavisolibacter sp.]|nr:phosphatase PAP2 family protein [Flavisolibacter sp.]
MKSHAIFLVLFPFSLINAQELHHPDSTLKDEALPAISAKLKKPLIKVVASLAYASLTYHCYKEEDNHFRMEMLEQKTDFNTRINRVISPIGLGETNWMALGGTTAFAYLTKDIRLQKAVYIWAGSLAINDMATNQLKLSFQRHRPATGASFNTFDWRAGPGIHKSMPSAHTSNAFATATVFATLYKEKRWVAPFAYGMAAMVGLSRVYDNAHWLSDVMAGAAVGFFSAKAMIAVDNFFSNKGIRIYPQLGRHTSVTLLYTFEK